jgi:hypothetical protein
MWYIPGWQPRTITLISLVLTLVFIIACGAAAPEAPGPESVAEPQDSAPAAAQEEAPQATATPVAEATAVPQPAPDVQTQDSTGPSGTLNVGLKEMGPFFLHPSTLGNPQIFVQGTAPIGEALLQVGVDREFRGLLAESWSISEDATT